MTFKRYLTLISFSALFSWSAWYLVIQKLNPYDSQILSLALFFVSLFFALTSTLTLGGFYLRKWFYKNEIFYSHLSIALRQSILLTLCIIGSLLFLMLGVLTWWDGLLLVLIIVLIEIYFSSNRR